MKGISSLTDGSGNKTAVVLDLKKHRRLWEDIRDRLLIESRRGEPREPFERVKRRTVKRPVSKAHA